MYFIVEFKENTFFVKKTLPERSVLIIKVLAKKRRSLYVQRFDAVLMMMVNYRNFIEF